MNDLSAGMTLQSKYDGLGAFGGPTFADLNSITSFIFSMAGHGKSALVQSNPEAFIFNLDLTTTVTRTMRAQYWPGLRDGRPVDSDGSPFILTYDKVVAKIEVLRRLSQNRSMRPRLIVIDSLSALIQIVMDHVVANAVRYNLSKKDLEDQQEGNKMAIYGTAYDIIYGLIVDLRSMGYGVCILGHVAKSKIPVGENLNREEITFSFGHGLWKRIAPIVDMAAMVLRVDSTKSEPYTEDVPDGKGGTFKYNKTRIVPDVRVTIDCVPPGFIGMTKSRVPFPALQLPEADSWAVFNAHYLKHLESAFRGASAQ